MCRQAPTGGPKPPRRCPMPGKFTLFLRYEGQFTVLFTQPECVHRHPALKWGRKRSALHRSSQRIAHGIAARCKGPRTALHHGRQDWGQGQGGLREGRTDAVPPFAKPDEETGGTGTPDGGKGAEKGAHGSYLQPACGPHARTMAVWDTNQQEKFCTPAEFPYFCRIHNRKKNTGNERYRTGWRVRHTALPYHQGHQQTAHAHL